MHEKQNAALLEKECGVVNQKKKGQVMKFFLLGQSRLTGSVPKNQCGRRALKQFHSD